jgi:hypothetical protein
MSAGQVWPSFSVYVSKPSTKSCTTNCSFFFSGAAMCTSYPASRSRWYG